VDWLKAAFPQTSNMAAHTARTFRQILSFISK